MIKIIRPLITTLFVLLYPYLVYLGMQQGVVWFAPLLFSGIYARQAWKATHSKLRLIKISIALGLLVGTVFFQAFTAKIMPIFIQVVLFHFFGRTLFEDKGPPLIERFVRLEFPEFPPGIKEYCRQLTILWTGFFGFNIIICIILALFAPVSWWALYTGILNLVLTGLLMIGEYIWRHFHFPDLDIPSPKSTLKTMIVGGRQIWLDVRA